MLGKQLNSRKLFQYSAPAYSRMAIIALIFFTIITIFVFSGASAPLDNSGVILAENCESTTLTKLMLFITFFGNYQFLVPANILLIVFFLYKIEKTNALIVLLVSITSLGWQILLKETSHRARPSSALVEGIKNFSYPSGHAMMAVAFYGLLILIISTTKINSKQKKMGYSFFAVLIILIGLSRIYLRVHYLTDVIAGYIFEIGWMSLILLLFLRLTKVDTQNDELLRQK